MMLRVVLTAITDCDVSGGILQTVKASLWKLLNRCLCWCCSAISVSWKSSAQQILPEDTVKWISAIVLICCVKEKPDVNANPLLDPKMEKTMSTSVEEQTVGHMEEKGERKLSQHTEWDNDSVRRCHTTWMDLLKTYKDLVDFMNTISDYWREIHDDTSVKGFLIER